MPRALILAPQRRSMVSSSPITIGAPARQEMEDTAFLRDRLQTAVTKLRERLTQVRAREQKRDRERRPVYDKVRAERDKLAEELARVYPEIEAQLTDLLQRMRRTTVRSNTSTVMRCRAMQQPSSSQSW